MATFARQSHRTRQSADDPAQPWLLDPFSRLSGGKPLHPAFLLFRPFLVLMPDFERKHAHFALDNSAVLEPFCVGERADGVPADRTTNACLLKRFARSRLTGRFALFRPALGNDPAPRFARRDEHELRPRAVAHPVRQGSVL